MLYAKPLEDSPLSPKVWKQELKNKVQIKTITSALNEIGKSDPTFYGYIAPEILSFGLSLYNENFVYKNPELFSFLLGQFSKFPETAFRKSVLKMAIKLPKNLRQTIWKKEYVFLTKNLPFSQAIERKGELLSWISLNREQTMGKQSLLILISITQEPLLKKILLDSFKNFKESRSL